MGISLFAAIDDVLSKAEPTRRGSAHDGVVSRRRMRGLHRVEMKERLAESHFAKQHLTVTHVTGAILVCRTTGAAADAVDVLVRLGGVFRKVNPSAEHAANVGVPLVETFLYDCLKEKEESKA